jgi:branched-chain amino acid transport system substrate-binding protein
MQVSPDGADRQWHDQARLEVPMVGSWTLSGQLHRQRRPRRRGRARCRKPSSGPTTPSVSHFINYLKTFNPKNQRIDSPVSAAQGCDSLPAGRHQAGQFDRRPQDQGSAGET